MILKTKTKKAAIEDYSTTAFRFKSEAPARKSRGFFLFSHSKNYNFVFYCLTNYNIVVYKQVIYRNVFFKMGCNMAIKTTIEQLEEVQTAISKVMSGQKGMLDGKSIEFADLQALSIRESMLLKRYKQETGTGGLKINNAVLRRD